MEQPISFYLHPGGADFGEQCRRLALRLGMVEESSPARADVALAPLLRRVLLAAEYDAPVYGTLIFHPSALPFRRGPDAIRNTVAAGDRVSAATWFWCDERLDAGDLCASEVVVLLPGESAGRAYHTRFIPAGLRALERALNSVILRRPIRFGQEEALATYDPKWQTGT
jgi:methionyl-tRNA formyltransferase